MASDPNDESVRREVVAANQRFYDAFAERSFEKLEAVWAREHAVAVIHPGWPPLTGRDAVLDSWRRIVGGPNPPDIRCSDAQAHVVGETALVLCTEHLPDADLIATNLFVREEATWRMFHHHAGPLPLFPPEDEETVH